MTRSKLYTVQMLSVQDEPGASNSTSVFAMGPLQAARMVLGPSIVTTGPKDSHCGRVWELRDDLTPTCTELYRSNMTVTPATAGRHTGRQAGGGEFVALVKILAISAAVAATSCFIVMQDGA